MIKFIDLFAGMGGFRVGLESALDELNIKHECVLSSEIKPYAVKVYEENFGENVNGNIFKIDAYDIPDFDILLAGFPCQPFSNAGSRNGFSDTRGTLFFEIERILREKKPKYFILENVEGLVTHDSIDNTLEIGNTLTVILKTLELIGYNVSWKVFNLSDFGIPQTRKRIFIVGSLEKEIDLSDFPVVNNVLGDILETKKPVVDSDFTRKLFSYYSIDSLIGKSIKDKRGGSNNIHSWDFDLKGSTTKEQKELLTLIFRERRKKHWSSDIGIKWMDGIPLTTTQIKTFFNTPRLQSLLSDLEEKGYLKLEHPKDIFEEILNDKKISKRKYRFDLEKGYNIVTGKLSFEFNQVLNPLDITPTIVATDADRLAVPDIGGIRKFTKVEKCRLFGFPDNYKLNVTERQAFDLFGNTVPVPVVSAIIRRIMNDSRKD